MRAPWAWRRRRPEPPNVTITLVADTTKFDAAMRRLIDGTSETAYRRRIAHEWSLAEAHVGVLLDDLARSVGLDPVKAWRMPRQLEQERIELADLHHPNPWRRRAAEAAWLRQHRAQRRREDM